MALFLDMDLSILGADEAEFDEYEANVRREYNWVDEEGWRVGRARVLKGLLGPSAGEEDGVQFGSEESPGKMKSGIYFTDLFRGLFEEKAREIFKRSLGKLESTASE